MVWLCFPGMTSSLANHRCTLSDVFSTIFLFLTFLNIHIYFIILKTYDQQFTLTTKKSLHIIFKTVSVKRFNICADDDWTEKLSLQSVWSLCTLLSFVLINFFKVLSFVFVFSRGSKTSFRSDSSCAWYLAVMTAYLLLDGEFNGFDTVSVSVGR